MSRKTSHLKVGKNSWHHEAFDTPLDEEVAERAYFLWESEGHPIGKEEEHWREAQKQISSSHAHDALENIS